MITTYRDIPATAFGLNKTDFPCCRGPLVREPSEFVKSRIPQLNPNHYFSPDVYRSMCLWWNVAAGEPLYVSGPAGSGKTSTVEQFMARVGMGVVNVMARNRMDRRELLGHWSLEGGVTSWVDGPALLAWRHGMTLVISEFSCAGPDLWVACNEIFEGAAIENEYTGEVVPRHPDARVVITDNASAGTAGRRSEGYIGRKVQDYSTIDRFWHVVMPVLDEDAETKLLVDTLHKDWRRYIPDEDLHRLCRGLARVAFESRIAASKKTVGFERHFPPISHRVCERIRDILCASRIGMMPGDGVTVRQAVRMSLTNALDRTGREVLETLICTTLGERF